MTDKIRIDLAELTLGELAELGDLLAPTPLTDMLAGPQQAVAIAAIVVIIKRRTDPDYSLEQARTLRMGDIDFVQPEGNSNGSAPGATLPTSLESGGSIPSA